MKFTIAIAAICAIAVVPTIAVDQIDALQSEVDGLEQATLDLANEVEEMREAFAQITQIMQASFVSN